ncbi:hypothetical protein CASFOL_018419 [Castilleja foliolosa]|uniref:Protein kinase domain-containing protein n=1 Tax=Castilleja foliolosa TaxID=1961234 RepID=A0ABD3D6P7_9LAMI
MLISGVDDDVVSRKVSWARSLSVDSTNLDSRHSEFDTESRKNWADSSELFRDFLTQGRANDLRVFTFSELKSATRGFNRSLVIGEGGFGCVYQGQVKPADSSPGWDSELNVAIKQLNRNGRQQGIQRLLVYELMGNKSLEDHLLTRLASSALPWVMRLKMAQYAARGLIYLHEEMEFQLTELCRFSGVNIYPGRGFRFIHSDSQVFLFVNSKCKRYFHNRLRPAKLTWTADVAAEAVKKRRRATKKPYNFKMLR